MQKQNDFQNSDYTESQFFRYALNVTRTLESTPCPSSNDLAALIDGKMDEKKRNEIFLHLDQCPDCYHEWLNLSAIKPSILYRLLSFFTLYSSLFFRSVSELFPWKMRKQSPVKDFGIFHLLYMVRKRWIVFPGAVMACLLIIFINTNIKPPDSLLSPLILLMIDESGREMQSLYNKGTDPRELLHGSESWLHSSRHYGFSSDLSNPANAEENFRRSFMAGVQAASRQFSTRDVKDTEEYFKTVTARKESQDENFFAEEFELGRWIFFLVSASLSNSELSPDFWNRQRKISELYFDRYNQKIDQTMQTSNNSLLPEKLQKSLTARIENIHKFIGEPDKQTVSRKNCRKIALEANNILKMLVIQ
ncbi:hypothetical protein MTBBW1_2420004 [Desulfamplus magnetovallimortis]|uniref:Zinc-finger domain-containing protein n=1 Tax=Desulfamplus magnetovallimortis TaxID=1246637 RepID=A0A1W1HEB0_9BACT|nr:zf-HC2 domain-containing protein [Desulfamplus magnetovallimortis]SLM30800.1 hypothetical protein MTBBW1_2420004 [Desulfamplus magnetovallimortis]